MSDFFYASLEPVRAFEGLARVGSYVPLPTDWSLVVADIADSTKAIEQGRYKNVNTVGVSVIAATRNAVRPLDIPYVFGGDGAVVCIPSRFTAEVRRALAATIAMSAASFDLRLRACVVPVSFIRERGLDVLAARHQVSEHYVQCALYGGGAAEVERSLKQGSLPEELLVDGDPMSDADYAGLECRWSEVPSPQDETVAVIVDASGSAEEALGIYRRVIDEIGVIYGDSETYRPVVEGGLRMTLSRSVLNNELQLEGWRRTSLRRLLDATKLRMALVIGWFLFRFGVRWGDVEWGKYKRDLVLNTDFRKLDGSLRVVLTGTEAQRAALVRYLTGLRDVGHAHFGMHVARSAVMTCLIEDRQGAHFHFVDASGGGYASAALDLKRSSQGEA